MDADAFHEIYRIGSFFLKSPRYFKFRGGINCFTASDPKVHDRKQRILAQPFSKTMLKEHWESLVVT